MADPGVSTQNFLRLLLGGMQQGADVFQGRQTQQQQQAPDLMMALQRMMQQKQERQEDVAYRNEGLSLDKRRLEQEHSRITADRMRQGGMDYQNAIQQVRENAFRQQTLKMTGEENASQATLRKAQAEDALSRASREEKSVLAQARLSMGTLLSTYKNSPESYETVSADAFKKMKINPDRMADWTVTLGSDGEPFSYRKMKDHVANEVRGIEAALKEIGGYGGADALTTYGADALFGVQQSSGGAVSKAPATDTKNVTADDYARYLEEKLK